MKPSRHIVHFAVPGGVVLAGGAILLALPVWKRIEPLHLDIAGSLLAVLAVLLAWRFDRSRLLGLTLLLVAADVVERSYAGSSQFHAIRASLNLLVPFNFILLALIPERGIASVRSLVSYAALPLQALLVYAWIHHFKAIRIEWLETQYLPLPYPSEYLTDASLAMLLLALLVQLVRYLRYPNTVESSLVWAALCATAAGYLFSADTATLLRIIALLIMALSVFEMSYALAYRDELTGLSSRRALMELFAKLGQRYTIAMADIDHFKKLNDSYGHDVGDQVLRMVAARLGKCGGGGKVYRYGGEEFTIVFPGRENDDIMEHLEALRADIADTPFLVRHRTRPIRKPKKPKKNERTNRSLKVTISIGCAQRSDKARTPDEVMKAADQALYRAKKAGRNRVAK